MKKSDKKKMIYDAMALRLAVALEWFLLNQLERFGITPESHMPTNVENICKRYCAGSQTTARIVAATKRITRVRNEVAHARRGFLPLLGYYDFWRFREDCLRFDGWFRRIPGEPGASPMSSIMFHSLPYDMGNAGDLIKHGALVLFIRWWLAKNGKERPFRFADPFGGCPWEDVENDEIERRLGVLESAIGGAAECFWRKGRYYNSGHVANFAARQRGGKAIVRTSDASDIARSDLMASALYADNMWLLGREYAYFTCDNGYSILKHARDFDLLLLDPFADFLLDEYKGKTSILADIKGIAERMPHVCVAVFVLDMCDNRIHDHYVNFKERELRNIAFSLRCPKILDGKVKGENKYNMEILLISGAFADGGGEDLRGRLAKLGDAVGKALSQKITMWP